MRALLFLPTGRHDQTGPVFGDKPLHMPTSSCVALIKREELRGWFKSLDDRNLCRCSDVFGLDFLNIVVKKTHFRVLFIIYSGIFFDREHSADNAFVPPSFLFNRVDLTGAVSPINRAPRVS